ncbi:hypothetical protein HpBT056_15370 [Helicobacter pylori]
MILENACEHKDYLGSVFDAIGFYGNFEVVGNNIELHIIRYYKPIKSYKEL